MRNLYIHIPFCSGKCNYCRFYSIPAPERALMRRYAHVIAERVRGFAPETLYFGGGTPSLFGAENLAEILGALDLSRAAEITVECHPASSSRGLFQTLRRAGVTRISIGAQSFCDATLARYNRRHNAAEIREAFACARAADFEDVGLDLIAGLDGVTTREWEETLDAAIALAPKHISVYALERDAADFCHDENAVMDTLAAAETRLAAEGFARYEISNYALPGYECRHNLAVWRGEDFRGFGPAAASRIGKLRRTNRPDLGGYLAAADRGEDVPAEISELSAEDDAFERWIFALRLNEGVLPLDPERAATLERLEKVGVVEQIPGEQNRFRLTARGREVADSVMAELT